MTETEGERREERKGRNEEEREEKGEGKGCVNWDRDEGRDESGEEARKGKRERFFYLGPERAAYWELLRKVFPISLRACFDKDPPATHQNASKLFIGQQKRDFLFGTPH